jgi:hypothetical protein
MLFANIRTFWKKYGMFVIIGVFLLLLLVGYIFGTEGTYSTHVYLPPAAISTVSKPEPKKDSRLEIATRATLEEMFQKPFPKIRPSFLNNPVTGGRHNLEIDCYNDELKLGVEVQGVQHYKYVPYFHKNYEAFMNQKYRDQMKRYLCKENGIRLIEVPYNVKESDVRRFLENECKTLGIKIGV